MNCKMMLVVSCLLVGSAGAALKPLPEAVQPDPDGLEIQTSDAKRWDAKLGLCMRPYTIDTWDFTFDPQSPWNRTIQLDYVFTEKGFRYNLRSPAEEVSAHLLVPSGKKPARLLVDGRESSFVTADVFGSCYVDVTVRPAAGVIDFEVLY